MRSLKRLENMKISVCKYRNTFRAQVYIYMFLHNSATVFGVPEIIAVPAKIAFRPRFSHTRARRRTLT